MFTVIVLPVVLVIRLITVPIIMGLFIVFLEFINLLSRFPQYLNTVQARLLRVILIVFGYLMLLGQGLILIPLNRKDKNCKLFIFNHTNMYDALVSCVVTPYCSIIKDSLINNLFCRSLYKVTRSYLAERPHKKSKIVQKYIDIQNKKGTITQQIELRLKEDPNFKLSMSPEGTILAQGFTGKYHTSIFRYDQPIQPVIYKYHTLLPTHWTTNHASLVILNYVFNPFGVITAKFLPVQTRNQNESVEEFTDRVGRLMAKNTNSKYVNYKNVDFYYATGLSKQCSDQWKQDFDWMGNDIKQFYRNNGINPFFIVYREDLKVFKSYFRFNYQLLIQTRLEKPFISGPKGLYAVYILRSMNEKYLDKCYIGYTPNPQKRIRMHNGQISGGARRTHNGRPWEMILFVSGFPNKIAGLKFEYILTYPTRSKYYSIVTQQHQKIKPVIPNKVKSAMDMLVYILSNKPYLNQPLTINFLSKDYYDKYNQTFIDIGFKTNFLLDYYVDKQNSVLADQIYVFQKRSNNICLLCKRQIGNTQVQCPNCNGFYCLSCLAGWLSQQSNTLIPDIGSCFKCQQQIKWKNILYEMQQQIIEEQLNNQIDPRQQIQLSNDSQSNSEDNQQDSDKQIHLQQSTPSFKPAGLGLLDMQLLEQQFNSYSKSQSDEQLKLSDLDVNVLKSQEIKQNTKSQEQIKQDKQLISISSSQSIISID